MRHRVLSILLTLLLTAGTATSVFAAQTLPADTGGDPVAVEEPSSTETAEEVNTNDSGNGSAAVESPAQEPEEAPAPSPQSDPQEPAAEPQTDPEQPSADAEVPSGNNAGG
ncbi:MAG: hypothetical protein IJH77_05300, partial [Mogibacterium sp.]|nr:hypothetical protein [Mogibacterium sp.]